ncbi:PssD/Cps14F family polysaccharide biosynthesis glycosyltransferase [Gloeocapsopsis dulcis]|uniref:UDP-N-acetylglucosamine--LPS N-acetylglucosamine transferase n=1 Tax=Gloeocapsopsis dulcis AAB1 = 1H9 TaxID=1433147 RepID=A0A6N8FSI9_9CHRO|nr:PssD/Cps14F family polysaccharide biosynthesis glycosyltransferase [Gloeocapsopsis dulcis]MUL35809.1 UDP-N-acetylglucosamine--LPS N-acetylglucosamine transferase [Gloeocapsopsis dulcis AAB1 = 1H9]WNN87724.1 PssD/Cps14F family polysaccharide biosynthesis glycosyltransferase [Gloeocapsopsis dulcis]
MKVILVCSTGGHFQAMQSLHPFWRNHQRIWVTFYSENTKTTLDTERVYWAWSPTNRNLVNLVRNFFLAWQILSQETPHLVISTGAGVAVPFLILAKLLGRQTIFIESITRVKQLSLSARLALPFLDTLYVHWPQLQARYPRAKIIDS